MKDEEYIEMLKDQREAKEKPVYAIRIPKDLYPVTGLLKHVKRCGNEMERSPLIGSSDWFASQCFARDFVLTLYNFAIIGGAAYGISKAIEYFSK